MQGTLVVEEPKSTIDKFRNWYQNKMIDSGKAANFEEKLEKYTEKQKTTIKLAGTVATIVLFFCPADGPVGEICSALATPLLATLVEKKSELLKKTVIGTKRVIEAKYLGVDGSSKDVIVPDFNFNDLTKDITDITTDVFKITNSKESEKKSK